MQVISAPAAAQILRRNKQGNTAAECHYFQGDFVGNFLAYFFSKSSLHNLVVSPKEIPLHLRITAIASLVISSVECYRWLHRSADSMESRKSI